jgi:ectoine hydroxylase-related dioxygenase (phytanoyl-CoA dioxygenase family)
MPVHQDMTLVDETEFTGINIWCPLIDLTKTNGVLYVLPGSHRLFPTYRGSSIPNIYENVYDVIENYMIPKFLKAGEAIIFDQSIIHYSPPNVSNEIRPVTNTYFTHKDAVFRTAYYDKENHPDKIELFDQDSNFMTNFEQFGENIFDRPKIGKSLGYFDFDFPKITTEMLEKKYGKKKSFINKILAVFE